MCWRWHHFYRDLRALRFTTVYLNRKTLNQHWWLSSHSSTLITGRLWCLSWLFFVLVVLACDNGDRFLLQWLSRSFGAAVALLMRTVVGHTGLVMVTVLCFNQDCPVKLAPVVFDLLVLTVSGPRTCVFLDLSFEALTISACWSLVVWDFWSRLLRFLCFSGCCHGSALVWLWRSTKL